MYKGIGMLTMRNLCLTLIFRLLLALAGCTGKGPTLAKTQSPDAPELYAQAQDLYGRASDEAEVKAAVAA